jgi:pilus assembly protein CpaE
MSADTVHPLGAEPRNARAGETGPATVMAFVNDTETEEVIRKCLVEIGVGDGAVLRGTLSDAASQIQKQRSPRILIVDVSSIAEPLEPLYRLADVCDPSTSVIVVGERSDIPFYRYLRDVGVAEYFFKPLVLDQLARCCEALIVGNEVQAGLRIGKLITVLGVQGGVGGTMIAVNAAWHVAEELQRRVILVDLNLQGGDAALQLDLTPSHALFECLEHPDRIDELFLERAVVQSAPRMAILSALEPLEQAVAPQDRSTLQVLSNLRSYYRYVVIDMPALIATQLKGSLQAPGIILLVSDGTLAAARDVGRWRRYLGPDRAERRVLHILNMARSDRDLPYDQFVKAIGQAPDLVIPYDAAVAKATNLGVAAIEKSTALRAKMTELFRHLIGGMPVEQKPSSLARFFGR